jgi:hypothetical protein
VLEELPNLHAAPLVLGLRTRAQVYRLPSRCRIWPPVAAPTRRTIQHTNVGTRRPALTSRKHQRTCRAHSVKPNTTRSRTCDCHTEQGRRYDARTLGRLYLRQSPPPGRPALVLALFQLHSLGKSRSREAVCRVRGPNEKRGTIAPSQIADVFPPTKLWARAQSCKMD